jgi:hypothetical protein
MKHSALVAVFALLLLVSCSSSSDILSPDQPNEADWVNLASQILSRSVSDPTGDFEASPSGAPPYSQPVAYAPADVTNVSFGLDDDYLYVQLDFDGNIPDAPQAISAAGEVESQTVLSQTFHLAMDTDNNDLTGGSGNGVEGVDVVFVVRADYGQGFEVMASHGLPSGEVSVLGGQIHGELGAGGSGSNFLLARFDLSTIDPASLPRGASVEVGGWSEAESNLYEDMTSDPLNTTSWSIPHASVPGSGVQGAHVPLHARN